jgi:hypothetical protein
VGRGWGKGNHVCYLELNSQLIRPLNLIFFKDIFRAKSIHGKFENLLENKQNLVYFFFIEKTTGRFAPGPSETLPIRDGIMVLTLTWRKLSLLSPVLRFRPFTPTGNKRHPFALVYETPQHLHL